jgi:hypothetical protein
MHGEGGWSLNGLADVEPLTFLHVLYGSAGAGKRSWESRGN